MASNSPPNDRIPLYKKDIIIFVCRSNRYFYYGKEIEKDKKVKSQRLLHCYSPDMILVSYEENREEQNVRSQRLLHCCYLRHMVGCLIRSINVIEENITKCTSFSYVWIVLGQLPPHQHCIIKMWQKLTYNIIGTSSKLTNRWTFIMEAGK